MAETRTADQPPTGQALGPTPAASSASSLLPKDFFARPAECVAPDLLGCWLVRRWPDGQELRGRIVETEAYAQEEPACHGHRRRSPSNETLFGDAGRFYVYRTYGIHYCVNLVTGLADQANGVLLRALELVGEPPRVAAGPALLARRFGLDCSHDTLPAHPCSGVWVEGGRSVHPGPGPVIQTTRIGISQGQSLPWRWYLQESASVSRRQRGDRLPRRQAGHPSPGL